MVNLFYFKEYCKCFPPLLEYKDVTGSEKWDVDELNELYNVLVFF
jgi:hypothetical protein